MPLLRRAGFVDTPGKRIHAAIVLVAVLYLFGHLVLGAWLCSALVQGEAMVSALMVTVTLITALGNLFIAAPLWVYAGVALIRGPRPMVDLPVPVADARLPRIFVQVPGRNEPTALVVRSIDSVLGADYPADRIAVQFIDNSDDERWKKIQEIYADEPRVEVVHREGTVGFKAGNLNRGLRVLEESVRGQDVLIGLLDVGDTFAPKVLRPMATEFVHDPKLGFVQGMFRIGNPHDSIINWSDSHVGDAARRFTEGYIAHYGIPTMNGHCALLRLRALEEIGGWNEARIAEDWSTGITMMTRGWKGKWVDYRPTDPAMVSTELSPAEIVGQQKQKRRWAAGGTELARLHLVEWLRSSLPWNMRLSLFLRLAANASVLPGLVAQLLLPVWALFLLTRDVGYGVMTYGIVSVVFQSPYFAMNTALVINYVRERNVPKAVRVFLAYPVQALWRLPLFVHAGIGVAEGLHRGLKDFVITPKQSSGSSVLHIVRSQSLVLVVSFATALPLVIALGAVGFEPHPMLMAALSLPLLTIAALFLVPITQFVRQTILPLFKLPRAVYEDGRRTPWVPSGWMGNLDALTVDTACTTHPHTGPTCLAVTYAAPDGWAGVAWHHAEDAGGPAGGLDLTGAKRLSVWARGEEGGEVIDLGVGLLGRGKVYPDTVRVVLKGVVLTTRWERYTIELTGNDLTQVRSPFFWRLEGQGRPITFYLDDVRFE
jgi:cellulose synthase/poly-beta-1,6-N-acetylglucosamine synthase-like glycosyltransferase